MLPNRSRKSFAWLYITLLLILDFMGLVSSSTRAQTPASDIIVEDADAVWTGALEHSADVAVLAQDVTPRVVAEYANSVFQVGLYGSDPLNQAAGAVLPRIIVEYGDSNSEMSLSGSDELNQAAGFVASRVIVEHADSIFSINLQRPPLAGTVTVYLPAIMRSR